MKADWKSVDWFTESRTDEEWYEQERWENKSGEQRAWETGEAWDRWVMVSCVERNRGHQWWLDYDEFDGVDFHCRFCPAGMDELYPDGMDLLDTELPLPDGTKLVISS